uniref:ZnMc domain-containing protein n=1 Tax=Parastrongyloides trichosuri TaxID=131310 RepID=A0A0N4ZAP6_PARTI
MRNILAILLIFILCFFENKVYSKKVSSTTLSTEIEKKVSTRKYPSRWTSTNISYSVEKGLNASVIYKAMKKISERSCLTFVRVKKNSELKELEEGLRFVNGTKCSAHLGKVRGKQLNNISVATNCRTSVPKMLTLVLQSLGVINQINRPDRNHYISLNLDGIEKGRNESATKQTTKFNSSQVRTYNIGYDYHSFMHLKSNAFRNDNITTLNSTIIPQYNDMMGQQVDLSFADLKLLNYHFCNKSSKTKEKKINCQNGGFIDPKNKSKCICPNGFGLPYCAKLSKNNDECKNKNPYINLNSTFTSIVLKENGSYSCNYLIKAPNNYKIKISIRDVNTEKAKKGQKCSPEMGLEIKHRNDFAPAGLCLCGNYSHLKFRSMSNKVMVLYRGKGEFNRISLRLTSVPRTNGTESEAKETTQVITTTTKKETTIKKKKEVKKKDKKKN